MLNLRQEDSSMRKECFGVLRTQAQRQAEISQGHPASRWENWEKDPSVLAPRLVPGWGRADGGWTASDGREGGTAEEADSDGAWQVAGLPAVSVSEVKGVQRLEVVRVGLQLHLAQELILQDSVVPDLGGERGWQGC